jgi:glycosyltransferase involved in cell wall biosynthesis
VTHNNESSPRPWISPNTVREMKKRILHVIGSLGGGGAEAVVHNLWPSLLRSDKYDFELCALRSLGNFGDILVSEGAVIHCLRKRKYDPSVVFALRRLLRQRGYDVVHAHLFPELYVLSLATVGLPDVRLVYTEHRSTNRRRELGLFGRMVDKLAYDRFDRIISVNRSTEQSLISWQPGVTNRSLVIRNCTRPIPNVGSKVTARQRLLEELGLAGSDKTLILFASRLHRQKGVDVLLTALGTLKRSDYLCLVAGTGEEKENLERMAGSLGLDDRVRFLGFRLDVPELLQRVDFMVLPSRYEGMPLIILEAMAAGCPIIATSVDGTAEVLRDETSALLVPSEDPAQLAFAIDRYLDKPSFRAELAENALIDSQDYSADEVAQQLFAVYDAALKKSPTVVVPEQHGKTSMVSG